MTAGEKTDNSEHRTGTRGEPRNHVSAHETSPERIVFVEEDNADAWISTDTTADCSP